jgi:hypothetical protein
MQHYCTLFDSNYLTRGLVTYESLMAATEQTAHLYVFAFDDKCYDVLVKMGLPNMTVISLDEFEDEALLAIKPTRTRGEYCWTCTSSTIYYVLNKYQVPHCIYIDADMFFIKNPKVLLDEMTHDKHVMITEHRYTPQYDKSKLSGTYCVQFMYFDKSPESMKVLTWWRERCLEWCYNRHEDGKFGDQKYLDDWATRFATEGVHILKHLGGGLAPWNVQQYHFTKTNSCIKATIKPKYEKLSFNKNHIAQYKEKLTFVPVFFHFHGVKLYDEGHAIYAPKMYELDETLNALFYKPYIRKLHQMRERVEAIDPTFDPNGTQPMPQYKRDKMKGWGAYFKTQFKKIVS